MNILIPYLSPLRQVERRARRILVHWIHNSHGIEQFEIYMIFELPLIFLMTLLE